MLLTVQATVAFHGGALGDALTFASDATELIHAGAGTLNEVFRQAWPVALEAATALGRPDRVERLLAFVSTDPTVTVPPYLRAQRLHYQALLDAGSGGERTTSNETLRTAIAMLGELGYPYWLAHAQLDLATGSSAIAAAEAVAVLDMALAAGQRLGAQPLVDDATRLVASASAATVS